MEIWKFCYGLFFIFSIHSNIIFSSFHNKKCSELQENFQILSIFDAESNRDHKKISKIRAKVKKYKNNIKLQTKFMKKVL